MVVCCWTSSYGVNICARGLALLHLAPKLKDGEQFSRATVPATCTRGHQVEGETIMAKVGDDKGSVCQGCGGEGGVPYVVHT